MRSWTSDAQLNKSKKAQSNLDFEPGELRVALALIHTGDVGVGQVTAREAYVEVELFLDVVLGRTCQTARLERVQATRIVLVIAAVELPVLSDKNAKFWINFLVIWLRPFQREFLEL